MSPMRRTPTTCSICLRPVVQRGERGRFRTVHAACKPLHDALVRVEKALALPLVGTMPPAAQVELRYRVLCLSTEIPRPRDASGRFMRRARG